MIWSYSSGILQVRLSKVKKRVPMNNDVIDWSTYIVISLKREKGSNQTDWVWKAHIGKWTRIRPMSNNLFKHYALSFITKSASLRSHPAHPSPALFDRFPPMSRRIQEYALLVYKLPLSLKSLFSFSVGSLTRYTEMIQCIRGVGWTLERYKRGSEWDVVDKKDDCIAQMTIWALKSDYASTFKNVQNGRSYVMITLRYRLFISIQIFDW